MEMMKVQRIVLNFMKMFGVVSFRGSNTCYGVWDFFIVVDGDCGSWVLGFIWGDPIFLFWAPFS
jgi:hypothetical protein